MIESLYQAVLGPAGVGKSYIINEKLKADPQYGLRCATTGIAAVNMSNVVGGTTATTINSALRYFDTKELLMKVASKSIQHELARLAKFYKNIIIDEVSMMEAAQLDLIYRAVEEFNKNNPNSRLGIYLTGDSGQLPAVGGRPFFDALCWSNFEVTYLTEVKRQQDKEFIEALQLIRKGKAADAVDWFDANIGFHRKVDQTFCGSTFYSKNNEVDAFNREMLFKLPGEGKRYTATILGKPHPTWKEIPAYVDLKRGALVQILVNQLNHGFANGDMGFVEQLYDNSIDIRLIRNGRYINLPSTTLKNEPPGSRTSIGTIRALRVRLAWAITIHRCQSMTMDAAQIKLGGSFLPRLSGGCYTALSRVRTKEGLRLVGTKDDFIKSVYVDPRYLPYIK